MRGNASPVLMATGLVNGRWQFLTPDRIHTTYPTTKNVVQVIMLAAPMVVPNLVQICPCGASGQMGDFQAM